GDDASDDLFEALAGFGFHDAGGVEFGQGFVAVASGLVARVVASARAFEDAHRFGDLAGRWHGRALQLAEALDVFGPAVLQRIENRQRLLVTRQVRRLLAGRLRRA